MVGSITDLILQTLFTAVVLILLVTFIGILILPFLNASNQDVRDLFLAVKDLALPMGSFPSKLLRHEPSQAMLQLIPTELNSQENHNVIKEVITQRIPGESSAGEDSRLIFMPSQPYVQSALSESQRLGSEDDLHNPYLNTCQYRPNINDGAETVATSVEGDLPTEVVEGPTKMSFDVNLATGNEATNYEPAAQITPPSGTSENLDESSERVVSDLSRMVKEKETLEAYIRQVADPEDIHDLAAMSLSSLIPWMMQDNERSMRDLRMESNKRDDEMYDSWQALEAVIIGQNLAVRNMDHVMGEARLKAAELQVENWDLRKRNREAKESYEGQIEELKSRAERAEGRAQVERDFADQVKAGVDDRIRELRRTHAEAMRVAADSSSQKQNSLICLKRMVHDDLGKAERQLTEQKQQHKGAMKEKKIFIKDLEETNKLLERTVEVSKQLAASGEKRLQKQLDDQRKEKNGEISALKNQLLESKLQSRMLDGWKLKQQLQSLELETAGLKKTIEDKDRDSDRNKQDWAAAKSTLENSLQQAQAASKKEIQDAVEKLETEKQELLRQVGTAQSNEQQVRTRVQSLEEEKVLVAEQNQSAMNWKDQKIRDLEQTIVGNNSRLEHEVGIEVARQLKTAVDAKEVEIWNEAIQQYGDRDMEHEEGDTNAAKEAKKRFQAHLDSERGTMRGNLSEATETVNNLRAEVGLLKSQIEENKIAAESADTRKMESERADNKKESSSVAKEMDETNSILEEIGEQGIPRICGERLLLNELNKAKKTLASVKHEVQQPEPDKNDLLYAISEAIIAEGRFKQCDFKKRPVLLRQARAANERLYTLQTLLNTDSEVQKDAVLGILQSPVKNENMALPDETGADGRSAERAPVNARQGQGDLIMGEASQNQNNTVPEASEAGNPPQSFADILATLQRTTSSNLTQAIHQHQPRQQQTGAYGQGFARPNQNGSMDQTPLPGLFQSQHVDQAPLPGWFPSQSSSKARQPVFSQPQGEIKMPRGFTRSMRQWAKGWVRTGDIKRAETLLLKYFRILRMLGGNGLESYLAQLKRQIEGQNLDQMEQPGGWTDDMTNLVENGLDGGKDLDTIVNSIKMDPSYPTNKSEPDMPDMPDMEGIELYVQKLTQASAPKPDGWTDEMDEIVRANLDIEFEFVEDLLKNLCDFRVDDTKSLMRYLKRLQRER